jgi:glycosyltransferase involved in cell wall biosynthesis
LTRTLPSLDVILLAYNEQDSIEQAIADVCDVMGPTGIDFKVIVVDDGSTDQTGVIANRVSMLDDRVVVRCHATNRGMGSAVRTGFAAGRSEYATMLPADRQIRADQLSTLLELAGPRVVVTSLYANRPNDALRTFASRAFRAVVRLSLGPTPVLEGTYVVPRTLLDEVTLVSDTFTVNFELLARARKLGYEVRVATIESHLREQGSSKVFNPGRIVRVVGEVARLGLRLRTE